MKSPRGAAARSAPRVLLVQYANPAGYPPVINSARLLAARGAEVFVLGVHTGQMQPLVFPELPGVRVRVLPGARSRVGRALNYARFVTAGLRAALTWRPDWVVAYDAFAAPLGVALTLLRGTRVAYHEHDAPSEAGRSGLGPLAVRARATLLRRAAFVVVPNAERARRLPPRDGAAEPVLTVWNCPSLAELPPLQPRTDGARLRVVYHGSISPDRLPLTVVEAVASVPESELVVVGYATAGAPDYLRVLAETARRLGAEDRVRIVGALPRREQVYELVGTCDVGLSLMPMTSDDVNMEHMVGASNKAFDNLACGLALLVSDLDDWRRAFVDAGHAVACDPRDAASIARALAWCVANRRELSAMGEAGRLRVEREWNYERQFSAVADRLTARPASAMAPARRSGGSPAGSQA